MEKALFLDRDGTIIIDKGYMNKIEDLELMPGVIKSLRYAMKRGYLLFIITNQSGIGRGYFTLENFNNFNNHLIKLLKIHNIEIQKTYYCPHAPEDKCSCRKPETDMVDEAVNEFDIDRGASFFIGDRDSDILCAEKSNIKSIGIVGGYKFSEKPDFIIKTFDEIINII